MSLQYQTPTLESRYSCRRRQAVVEGGTPSLLAAVDQQINAGKLVSEFTNEQPILTEKSKYPTTFCRSSKIFKSGKFPLSELAQFVRPLGQNTQNNGTGTFHLQLQQLTG
jgi:hypothetical protein